MTRTVNTPAAVGSLDGLAGDMHGQLERPKRISHSGVVSALPVCSSQRLPLITQEDTVDLDVDIIVHVNIQQVETNHCVVAILGD
ncbi:hypothetical protein [Mycobacterium uberis]|uniref:hypothetical protein n=1 Tax=Mycobacterium uberis TaxID=2162698 RepID=UPI000E30000D|nr:hypothetical protein [Mycobacterium uberis]